MSAPGPTLDDVKAELGLDEVEVEADEEMLERVRDAVVEEAVATVEDQSEDDGEGDDGADPDEDSGERPEAETHHRFSKRRPRESDDEPKRIIRLRDKRRRRGSDPPED